MCPFIGSCAFVGCRSSQPIRSALTSILKSNPSIACTVPAPRPPDEERCACRCVCVFAPIPTTHSKPSIDRPCYPFFPSNPRPTGAISVEGGEPTITCSFHRSSFSMATGTCKVWSESVFGIPGTEGIGSFVGGLGGAKNSPVRFCVGCDGLVFGDWIRAWHGMAWHGMKRGIHNLCIRCYHINRPRSTPSPTPTAC